MATIDSSVPTNEHASAIRSALLVGYVGLMLLIGVLICTLPPLSKIMVNTVLVGIFVYISVWIGIVHYIHRYPVAALEALSQSP
jgi:hypothetical protein